MAFNISLCMVHNSEINGHDSQHAMGEGRACGLSITPLISLLCTMHKLILKAIDTNEHWCIIRHRKGGKAAVAIQKAAAHMNKPKLYWALFFNKEINDACYEQITYVAVDTLIETHSMHGKEYFMILNCYDSMSGEFYIKSAKFLDKEIYKLISIEARN